MSYDIAFWRYVETLDHDHHAVYSALVTGKPVEGLAELDTDAMIYRLAEKLSGWTRTNEGIWEKSNMYLQTATSLHHISINMSFGAARPILLRITTPMRRFGCGLWNAQMGLRLAGYGEAGAKEER